MNKRCAGLWPSAMLMLSALALMSCAAPTPEIRYLKGDSRTVAMAPGEPAPFVGWLLSDQALVELLECCGDRVGR